MTWCLQVDFNPRTSPSGIMLCYSMVLIASIQRDAQGLFQTFECCFFDTTLSSSAGFQK